jgi:hypothetical protein
MPVVTPAPPVFYQFFDGNGDPLAGGLLYTKAAGTDDDKATYSDAEGTVANANPVVLDSEGRCSIFLESGAYKFILKTAAGVAVGDTIDGVRAFGAVTRVDSVDALRALTPGTDSLVQTTGYAESGDGGGWIFYWDDTSSASDDGGMVIQPSSLPSTGRWLGITPDMELNVRIYGAACDGSTDDVSELQACDAYCTANDKTTLIDNDLYVASDPSLSGRVHLAPGAIFKWGSFQPTLDLRIDLGDKTQHFNCAVEYVPITTIPWYYPEWFGETFASMPITLAAITARTVAKNPICVSGEMRVQNGNVSMIVGADEEDMTLTDATGKRGRIAFPPYALSQDPTIGMSFFAEADTSILRIGGGTSRGNTCTKVSVYTAADNVTPTGTKCAEWDETGKFIQEEDSELKGDVTLGGVLSIPSASDAPIINPSGDADSGIALTKSYFGLVNDGTTRVAINFGNGGSGLTCSGVGLSANGGFSADQSGGDIYVFNLPVYADNTAAMAGGLQVGRLYRLSTGTVRVVYE